MTTLTDDEVVVQLDGRHRCDGCGARAYVLVGNEAMDELLFCFHHFKEHKDALLGQGWSVLVDQTSDLEPVESKEIHA